MEGKVKRGYIIFRQWDEKEGLSEVRRTFDSLEEMFQLCLQAGPSPMLVDRVVIEGTDEQDVLHSLTLVFQSVNIVAQR